MMVGFNVKALYMSLPIHRTLEAVHKRLEADEALATPLTADEVPGLLETYVLRQPISRFKTSILVFPTEWRWGLPFHQ